MDPATGLPRVTSAGPVRMRKPIPLNLSIIVASAIEYMCSAVIAVVLLIGGIRAISGSGTAPRLHGAYAIAKVALAIASCIIATLAMQQLVDGGFRPSMNWGTLIMGLILQVAYPAIVVFVFAQDSVREFYRHRGIDSSMVPISWLKMAERFSPDAWQRVPSLAAGCLGVLVLVADYYLWSHSSSQSIGQSAFFYPSVLGGFVLLAGGVAGSFRRAGAPLAIWLCALALLPTAARADDADATTQQILDQACAAKSFQRGPIFQKLIARDDAFLPLMTVATDAQDPYNRTLAKETLKKWLAQHPRPDSSEAKSAISAAIDKWLAQIHSRPMDDNGQDTSMIHAFADTSQIIGLVEPWLQQRPGRSYYPALRLIAAAKPDNEQKWNVLVKAVDDPVTRNFAAQLLRQYQAKDYQERLADMARNDSVPESRLVALDEIQNAKGGLLSPSAESVVTAATKDPDARVRSHAMLILSQRTRGGEVKTAGLLRSPTLKSRQEAAKALAIDPDEQKVLPVITDPLRDKDPAVRAAALVAWQRERYERPNLIPIDDLLKLLEDPDPQVRFQAACAVKSCRPAMAALGPYTSALVLALEREGLAESRRQGILTDTPAPSELKHANESAPTYDDANPLTGAAIPIATSAPVGASAPFLPTLALCISSLAIPGLVFVIVGVIAKARLASL